MVMKHIQLTQGKFALVDNVDFEYLNQWKWYAHKRRKTWYAGRNVRSCSVQIQMHQLILKRMGYIRHKLTDHKNGNGLDNRRHNLRPATFAQNNHNRQLAANNTSGYKGVYWFKRTTKWVARIMVHGKYFYLGAFQYKIDAAKAYNKAAKKFFGKFAKVNKIW